MAVNLSIPELGDKLQDYRNDILGDSFNWGPVIKNANVQYFAFHHSVTKQTAKVDGDWKKECDEIAKIHVNTNGWGGVGYRFIICSDGTVAYVGDLSHGGSAVANKNDIVFSACLVGDFTKELPTAAQVTAAHKLAKYFLTQAPQYPNLNNWNQVKGHKELQSTACPGSNWKTAGDNLYTRIVNDTWQGYPDPQPSLPPIIPPVNPPNPPTPVGPTQAEYDAIRNQLVAKQKELDHALEQWGLVKARLDQIKSLATL